MRKRNSPAWFPLGLLLLSSALAIYKSVLLSQEMVGSLAVFPRLVSLDFSFLALLGLVGIVVCHSRSRWLRGLLTLALSLAVAFYVVHSFVLLELDEAMSLADVGRYLPETAVVGSFLNPVSVAAMLAWFAAIGLRTCPGPSALRRLAWVFGVLLISGLALSAQTPAQLQKYGLLRFESIAAQWVKPPTSAIYTPEQLAFYANARPGAAEMIPGEPNIILLIVESLSSINSQRVSGERDLVPAFDRLSEEGVLFTNFLANHAASEGGLISLLSGFPPLHYPTATPLMFDEFAMQSSVTGEYRSQGYFTEFLTNADLSFIGLDRYLAGLGIDLARGRDEVPEFSTAPRIVQDAPSDRYLYAEALARIDAQMATGRPWLMTIATVSTHLPYRHPEGGEDTAEAVWAWSLDQLVAFYEGLRERQYFDNGLLLITGDHRQMRPLTRQETRRYGDSAKARVPLLAIGPDLPPGRIDERYFQQSDLLRYLGRIVRPGLELSPHPTWVERYNRIYGRVESINRFAVFDADNQAMKQYSVQVHGTDLDWPETRPPFSRVIEARVHAQRSSHQFNRESGSGGCVRQAGHPDEVHETNLRIETGGLYWFRTDPKNSACVFIDGQLVIDQRHGGRGTQGAVELAAGAHALEMQFWGDTSEPLLQWVPPGLERWRWSDVGNEQQAPRD